MSYRLDIPESIAGSLRLPEAEIEPRLRMELSLALYTQGILSFGKASELAEMPRAVFAETVAQRNIPRHYSEQEMTRDLDYAGRAEAVRRMLEFGDKHHLNMDEPITRELMHKDHRF